MSSNCDFFIREIYHWIPTGTQQTIYAAIGIPDYKGISFAAGHLENKAVRHERPVSAYYGGQIRNGGGVRESRNDVPLQLAQSNTATSAATSAPKRKGVSVAPLASRQILRKQTA